MLLWKSLGDRAVMPGGLQDGEWAELTEWRWCLLWGPAQDAAATCWTTGTRILSPKRMYEYIFKRCSSAFEFSTSFMLENSSTSVPTVTALLPPAIICARFQGAAPTVVTHRDTVQAQGAHWVCSSISLWHGHRLHSPSLAPESKSFEKHCPETTMRVFLVYVVPFVRKVYKRRETSFPKDALKLLKEM